MIRWLTRAILACCSLLPLLAQAEPAPDVEALRRDVAEARARLEAESQRLTALEQQLASLSPAPADTPADAALTAQLAAALASSTPDPEPSAPSASAPAAQAATGGGRLRLLDLSIGGLFAAGTSTANSEDLAKLEAGGHDPRQRGITVQNVELSLRGAVDPYLQGEAHVVLQIDEAGETGVELEEAFLRTTSLPKGLELKAGHYFTEFGRLNPQHPHRWLFVNQPVINSRLLGPDGLRGPGARLSWLTPAPWYSELTFGVQNANGETATSFLSNADQEPIGGHPHADTKVLALHDMLWSARWLNSFSVSKSTTLNLGASALFGPNATGQDARTAIGGVDAYLNWKPAATERGFPFVAWQTEFMARKYDAAEFIDATTGVLNPKEDLHDAGFYSQVTYGFRPGWTIGMRLDHADGDECLALDSRGDSLRDRRDRISTALTYYPTEFSKVRLQYDLDRSQFLADTLGDTGTEHSFWVQWEFNLGAHGTHAF